MNRIKNAVFFLLNFIEPILVGETNNSSMFPGLEEKIIGTNSSLLTSQ